MTPVLYVTLFAQQTTHVYKTHLHCEYPLRVWSPMISL